MDVDDDDVCVCEVKSGWSAKTFYSRSSPTMSKPHEY